jgi:hypothetical protein
MSAITTTDPMVQRDTILLRPTTDLAELYIPIHIKIATTNNLRPIPHMQPVAHHCRRPTYMHSGISINLARHKLLNQQRHNPPDYHSRVCNTSKLDTSNSAAFYKLYGESM